MFETISNSDLITLVTVLAISATVSGFMAGLLGVGGGIIMVPALYFAFETLNFDPSTIMHLSLGTSLAIIIPTSIMSTKTHMQYDAVDFKLIKSFGLFVAGGVLLGTVFASNLETPRLVLIFSVFAFCVGLFFIFFREKLGETPRDIPLKIKSFIGGGSGNYTGHLGQGPPVGPGLADIIDRPVSKGKSIGGKGGGNTWMIGSLLNRLGLGKITGRLRQLVHLE